jgi:hypothetical protein
MTKGMPVDLLQSRASEQRRRLHNDVAELKLAVREELDVRKRVAPYALPASGVAALFGLICGYVIAGMFTD